MRVQNIDVLYKKIVDWAKEQGRIFPEGLQMERGVDKNGEITFIYHIPPEIKKFIDKTRTEILDLDNSMLRKLEYKLLHIPEERGFSRSQIEMLNTIRSIVFMENQNRKNPKPIEPGE